MKLTDNMLRVINHAYTNYSKMEFLIKTNILQLQDEEIIVKAIEVAAMISKLVEYIDTDSEKRFYAYLSSVEGYNKELIRERSTFKDIVTLKEFIIGNGLVYSEFLDYVYESLTKYQFTGKSKEELIMSLNKTHTKLRNILNLKGGQANSTDLDNIQSEMERINSLVESFEKDMVYKSTKLEAMNKSIESTKGRLKELDRNIAGMPLVIDYDINFDPNEILEDMKNEIRSNIETKLEAQVNVITKAVIKQIDYIDIDFIEQRLVQGIESHIQNLLDTISTNVQKKVESLTLDDIDRKVIDAIANKIKNILNSAKSLNNDKTLYNAVTMLNSIADYLENTKTNNKACKDLIDFEKDCIDRYRK